MKINNINKILRICSIVLVILNLQFIKSDPLPSTAPNHYKNLKEVKHSLFREKDTPERMSDSQEGIPPTEELK